MTATVLEIGYLFLNTYYERMKKDPSKVSALYSNTAELTHINYQAEFPSDNYTISTVKLTGKENITKFFTRNNKKVCDLKVKINSCDVQTTGLDHSGILIMTTGELFWTGTPTYSFCQSFVLSKLEDDGKVYDITNDIIRFIPEVGSKNLESMNEIVSETEKTVEDKVEVSKNEVSKNEVKSDKGSVKEVEKEIVEEEKDENAKEKKDSKEKKKESKEAKIAIKDAEFVKANKAEPNSGSKNVQNEENNASESQSNITSPVPVKMSWASKLSSIDPKTTKLETKEEANQEISKNSTENKVIEINRKENSNSRNGKKKQVFSTVNRDGFYPIYIRNTAGINEDRLKKALEKEFGHVMKITNADNFAVADFKLQKSQTDALEKKKMRVDSIEIYLERKTLKKNSPTSPVLPSNTTRQHKKHHGKKRDQ